jgi:hypothetical protein
VPQAPFWTGAAFQRFAGPGGPGWAGGGCRAAAALPVPASRRRCRSRLPGGAAGPGFPAALPVPGLLASRLPGGADVAVVAAMPVGTVVPGTIMLLSTTGLCRHADPALRAGSGPGGWSIGAVRTGSMFHRPGWPAGLARRRRDGWDRWCWRAPAAGHVAACRPQPDAAAPRQRPQPGSGRGVRVGPKIVAAVAEICRERPTAENARNADTTMWRTRRTGPLADIPT